MNQKEFEKTIKIVNLAKTDDTKRIILTNVLEVTLKGGKIKEKLSLYSLIEYLDFFIKNTEDKIKLKSKELKKGKRKLFDLLTRIMVNKEWTTEINKYIYYDENGKEIGEDIETIDRDKTISKKVEIIEKTTYYLDEPFNIKPLKKL